MEDFLRELVEELQRCLDGTGDKYFIDLHDTCKNNEYSRAVTPQVRQAGNRLSGLTETAYASLLA